MQWLQKRDAYLAMLCKTSVARKLLNYLHSNHLNIAKFSNFKINAKKYFNVDIEACLLFCQFDSSSKKYFCDVFSSLEESNYYRTGFRNNILIRDDEKRPIKSSILNSLNLTALTKFS
ncbi:hypothetical protein [Scytonema sp. NUACC21]